MNKRPSSPAALAASSAETAAAFLSRSRKIVVVVAAAIAAGAGLWLGYVYRQPLATVPPPTIAGLYLEPPIALAPFTLTQHSGEPLTLDALKGSWNVLMFGYTYCPDMCPTTLHKLGLVARQLAEQDEDQNLTFWFVSVDPDRDTPERLAEYVPHFHPAFRGATGAAPQLDKLTGKLGIYYRRQPPESGSNAYLVDHSGAVVVLNPYADYQAVFTRPPATSPETLAADIVKLRRYWRQKQSG